MTALIGVIAVMAVLVAFSVPLYRLFCAATGLGGTPRRADAATGAVAERTVAVRFNTDVAPGLAWRFEPVQREVRIRLGEEKLVFFSTENLTDKPIVGHATFNVMPMKAAQYFTKVQCFCFDEERLGARRFAQNCTLSRKPSKFSAFHKRPVCEYIPTITDFCRFSLSKLSFKTACNGNGDLERPTASGCCPLPGSFEQIVR